MDIQLKRRGIQVTTEKKERLILYEHIALFAIAVVIITILLATAAKPHNP